MAALQPRTAPTPARIALDHINQDAFAIGVKMLDDDKGQAAVRSRNVAFEEPQSDKIVQATPGPALEAGALLPLQSCCTIGFL